MYSAVCLPTTIYKSMRACSLVPAVPGVFHTATFNIAINVSEKYISVSNAATTNTVAILTCYIPT